MPETQPPTRFRRSERSAIRRRPSRRTSGRRLLNLETSCRRIRVGCPAELLAGSSRERADDEVVGVLDQVADELVRQAAVERDRVPVALVQVVAGANRGIAGAQRDGELGLALDAHVERRSAERADGEDLARDLEDRGLGPEWELLDRARLLKAPYAEGLRVHQKILPLDRNSFAQRGPSTAWRVRTTWTSWMDNF